MRQQVLILLSWALVLYLHAARHLTRLEMCIRDRIHSERKVIAGKYLNIVYTFLGFAIVAGLTLLKNSGHIGLSVNFHDAGAVDLIYVFIAGVIAVTAMILPGISGSTMLLIMGVYLQAVEGIHEVLMLDFSSLPSMICLAAGILFGIIFSMNLISRAFKRFRCQMVYLSLIHI